MLWSKRRITIGINEEETMANTISKGLRNTFLVHTIFSAILGLALFVIPGRVLTWLGWIPEKYEVTAGGTSVIASGTLLVDPVITRVLGAALLALAFASFLGWRAKQHQEVSILVQLDLVFCVLALAAFLFRIVSLGLPIPVIGWVLIVTLLGFAVAWGLVLRR
jgi:hypothetical protein